MHNFSGEEIPSQILDILKFGLSQSCGGTPNIHKLLISFEALFSKWERHAKSKGLSNIQIFETKVELGQCFFSLKKVFTPQNKSKMLNEFLNKNPQLVLLKVDKSRDICIMRTEMYFKKLDKEFDNDKFRRIAKDPLKLHLREFNEILKS